MLCCAFRGASVLDGWRSLSSVPAIRLSLFFFYTLQVLFLLSAFCTPVLLVAADSPRTRARITTDESNNVRIRSAADIYLEPGGLSGSIYVGGADLVATLSQQAEYIEALKELAVPTSSICSGRKTPHLDCSSKASRVAVSGFGVCEVESVSHCCCEAFQGLRHVSQSVTVCPATAGTVSFGNITHIGGLLALDTNFTAIDFGQVLRATGIISIRNHELRAVHFGSLTSLHALNLASNSVTALDFAHITSAPASVFIDCPALHTLNFGNLSSVDGGIVLLRSALQSLDLNKLAPIGDKLIVKEQTLSAISFGMLTSISGNLGLQQNSLKTINFAGVQSIAGAVDLSHNQLTYVEFGALTQLSGDLNLANNELTALEVGPYLVPAGSIDASHNELHSISFASVFIIQGSLSLRRNHLSSIDLGTIKQIAGDVDLSNNSITALRVDGLYSVRGTVNLNYNNLQAFYLPGSVNIQGDLSLRYNQLSSVELVGLVRGTMDLRNNPLMTHVSCTDRQDSCVLADDGVNVSGRCRNNCTGFLL